jgi:hypothetical protein
MNAAPAPVLKAMAPDRAACVGWGEGLVTWDWLAARGAQDGRPCGLGPALSLTARHGGTAHTARSAAHPGAGRRRGGMRPQASVEPAGQQNLARLATRHGPGNAVTGRAPPVARAVYGLGTRDPACEREPNAGVASKHTRTRGRARDDLAS